MAFGVGAVGHHGQRADRELSGLNLGFDLVQHGGPRCELLCERREQLLGVVRVEAQGAEVAAVGEAGLELLRQGGELVSER